MGIFDFIKGKKDTQEKKQKEQSEINRFQEEIFATIPRYISKPGAEVDINARHKETNEIIPFAIGFPEQFEPWRTVKSKADRRGIIYSLMDSQFGNQLELWQAIERFNDDRYAEKALQIAIENKQESDEKNANYWNALARTNLILTNYEDAERNCLTAIKIDNNNVRTKRVYADVLHCTGREKEAHEIYNEILKQKLPGNKSMNLPIQELLGFDGNIINSPIYAIGWLTSDKSITPETWEWANEEFYYSPHFRSQYAFHLINKNDHMKGFVKLLQLSKEMPWYKEGVINSYNLIDQLNLGERMQAEKIRLKAIINSNNWE